MKLIKAMARACAAVTADDMNNPEVSAVDFDRVRAALDNKPHPHIINDVNYIWAVMLRARPQIESEDK